MINSLKLFYWKIEALLFESLIRRRKVNVSSQKHSLSSELIISLTSFSKRFNKLDLTIKSLLSQSLRPDKILLWIAYEDYNDLPDTLLRLERNFEWFEIKQCEDIRSYKKLIFSLALYPSAYIVTADDDVYYPPVWLKSLICNVSEKREVIAHRVHIPNYSKGAIAPYSTWSLNVNQRAPLLFATGIGGILYPPNAFIDEVTNKEVFWDICRTADDVWFFWMARLNNTPTVWSGYNFNIVNWKGTDESGLAQDNVALGANDICINNMLEKYGNVFDSD